MQVFAKVVKAVDEPIFEIRVEVDAVALTSVAGTRAEIARQKGAAWSNDAMPYFANDLLQGVAAGELVDVQKAVCDLTMTALLCDTVFGEVTVATFLASTLFFTVFEDGRVVYDRAAPRNI